MKKTLIAAATATLLVTNFTGCTQNTRIESPKVNIHGFSFIEGKIIGKIGNKIVVEINDKEIIEGDGYIDKLSNAIMKNSLFVIGMETSVDGIEGKITDIRGKQLTIETNPVSLVNDQIVKIYIPKKTIAVVDFSLIGIDSKTLDKFAMEDMITKLVQSGQYLVVERSKLNAILEEHKLVDSGLLDESSSKRLGKLLSADIILTGTFSKRGANWVVNLRLVDVKTGVILAAITQNISGKEFRWEAQKDTSNFSENFEDQELGAGWVLNVVNKESSQSKGKIDLATGANGTNQSYKIEYNFKNKNGNVFFINNRLRDISSYHGISFYAKADKSTALRASIFDKNYDDSNDNKWVSVVNVDVEWKKYEIPFDQFIIGHKYLKEQPGGDGKLDLDNIHRVMIQIIARDNDLIGSGSVWIDEISFY